MAHLTSRFFYAVPVPCEEEKDLNCLSDVQNLERRAAYSVKEFCHLIGIGRTNFYALLKRRQVRTIKLGGRRLVPSSELFRLMHSPSMQKTVNNLNFKP